MLALSANGALGHAGLLLVLAASVVGALSTGLAIVPGNRRGVRQAPVYAWLVLAGALLAALHLVPAVAAGAVGVFQASGAAGARGRLVSESMPA